VGIRRVLGSHQQLTHARKRGTVALAGRPSMDLKPATWSSILRQAGICHRVPPGSDA